MSKSTLLTLLEANITTDDISCWIPRMDNTACRVDMIVLLKYGLNPRQE